MGREGVLRAPDAGEHASDSAADFTANVRAGRRHNNAEPTAHVPGNRRLSCRRGRAADDTCRGLRPSTTGTVLLPPADDPT